MNLSRNVLLKPYTTFRIGGRAAHFISVTTLEELVEALSYARKHELSIQIFAGGSNMLFSDTPFYGLVVKIEFLGIDFEKDSNDILTTVGAGENLDTFITRAIKTGYHGVENLSGIPGTVGATPIQNVGAYGVEVSDVIEWVEVFDRMTGGLVWHINSDCNFSYRSSRFKTPAGKNDIVTRVCFRLRSSGKPVTHYLGVREELKKRDVREPTLTDMRNVILSLRRHKFPDLKKYGTAGSFFKNPIVRESKARTLLKDYPSLPNFPTPEGKVKLSLAWILDHVCGLKGHREGAVGTFNKQSLVIVNYNSATQQEVIAFSNKIKDSVKELTGITIIPEVTIL